MPRPSKTLAKLASLVESGCNTIKNNTENKEVVDSQAISKGDGQINKQNGRSSVQILAPTQENKGLLTDPRMHPGFMANMWQPGQSGNPNGRPKRRWLTDAVEELLDERLGNKEDREYFKQQMWAKLNSHRVIGAMTLDRVWERTEGKLVTPVELQGEVDIKHVIEAARKRIKDDSEDNPALLTDSSQSDDDGHKS
jgi:hypothetical protein